MKKTVRTIILAAMILVLMLVCSSIAFANSSSTPDPPPKDYSGYHCKIGNSSSAGGDDNYRTTIQSVLDYYKSSSSDIHIWITNNPREEVTVYAGQKVTFHLNNQNWYTNVGSAISINGEAGKTTTVTIVGNGTIWGGTGTSVNNVLGNSSAMKVGGCIAAQNCTLTISDVTLQCWQPKGYIADAGSGIAAKNSTVSLGNVIFNHYVTRTSASADNCKGTVCLDNSTITVTGNTAFQNTIANMGGGFYLYYSTLNWKASTGNAYVTYNSKGVNALNTQATNQGGFIYGDHSTVNLEGGTFAKCTSGSWGGGMCLDNECTLKMTGGNFIDCTAKQSGGGVQVYNTTKSILINGNGFSGCTALAYGGGVSLQNVKNARVAGTLTFDGCSAVDGGAIAAYSGTILDMANVDNIQIKTCKANRNGSAIYSADGTLTMSGYMTISGNTFTKDQIGSNASSGTGNIIYASKSTVKIDEGTKSGAVSIGGKDSGASCLIKLENGATLSLNNATLNGNNQSIRAVENAASTVTLGNVAELMNFKGDYVLYNTGASTITMSGTSKISSCTVSVAIVNIEKDGKMTMEGTSSLSKCTVTKDMSAPLYNEGTLIIKENASFKECVSAGAGCIYNAKDAKLQIYGPVSFTNCKANAHSGGVIINYGTIDGAIQGTGATDSTLMKVSGCTSAINGGFIWSDSDVTLKYVKISNCSASGNGGAVYCEKNLTLDKGVTIDGCSSGKDGGGVYCNALNMKEDATITSCNAGTNGYGGGVYSAGNVGMSGTSKVSSCTARYGGGVYFNKGTLTMSDTSTIYSCKATYLGGGVYVPKGCTLSLSGSCSNGYGNIDSCKATEQGGGIYNLGTVNMSNKAVIRGNHLDSSSYETNAKSGGGVYNGSGATLSLSGNTGIEDCKADFGAGVYNGGKFEMSGTTTIVSCVGTKGGKGAGLYNASGATFTMNGTNNTECKISQNSIVYDPTVNGTDCGGGGIYNAGTATINIASISYNAVGDGHADAIYGASGSKTEIKGATIITGSNGLIHMASGAKLSITDASTQIGGINSITADNASDVTISGGWFMSSGSASPYLASGYNISPRLYNLSSLYESTPYKVYPDSDKAIIKLHNNTDRNDPERAGYVDEYVEYATIKGYSNALPECVISYDEWTKYWECNYWDTTSAGNGTKYLIDTMNYTTAAAKLGNKSLYVTGDTDLYAYWTVIPGVERKIYYHDTKDAISKEVSTSSNSATIRVTWPNYEIAGFTLTGFNSNKSGMGTSFPNNCLLKLDNRTLNAHLYTEWTSDAELYNGTDSKIIYVNVTGYDTTTKEDILDTYTYYADGSSCKLITVGKFTKEGMTFDCWEDRTNPSNVKQYYPGDTYEFTSSKAYLYAVWKDKEVASTAQTWTNYDAIGGSTITYTEDEDPSADEPMPDLGPKHVITYVDPSGNNNDMTMTFYGDSATVVTSNFKRFNYSLMGWSKTNGSSTVDYKFYSSIETDSDLTLYAVWKEDAVKQDDPADPFSGDDYDPIQEEKIEKKSDNNTTTTDPEDDPSGNGGSGESGNGSGNGGSGENGGTGESGDDDVYDNHGNGSNTNSDGEVNQNSDGTYTVSDDFLDETEKTKWYYEAAMWAAENGIIDGSDPFNVNGKCTRAEMMLYLWRTAGCPDPVTTINPFDDISSASYYYKAVLWGYENGITAGTSPTTFSPDMTCTRAHALTFLYVDAGSPSVNTASATKFSDVSNKAWYLNSTAWGVTHGITAGMTNTTFGPDVTCVKGYIITFIYQAVQNNEVQLVKR